MYGMVDVVVVGMDVGDGNDGMDGVGMVLHVT